MSEDVIELHTKMNKRDGKLVQNITESIDNIIKFTEMYGFDS